MDNSKRARSEKSRTLPRDRAYVAPADLQSALRRIRQAACRDKKLRFTSLWHHVYNVDRLRKAYFKLKRKAAARSGSCDMGFILILNSDCALLPEVGALCGSSARRDLCGGRRVTGVPTAKAGGRAQPTLLESIGIGW